MIGKFFFLNPFSRPTNLATAFYPETVAFMYTLPRFHLQGRSDRNLLVADYSRIKIMAVKKKNRSQKKTLKYDIIMLFVSVYTLL